MTVFVLYVPYSLTCQYLPYVSLKLPLKKGSAFSATGR